MAEFSTRHPSPPKTGFLQPKPLPLCLAVEGDHPIQRYRGVAGEGLAGAGLWDGSLGPTDVRRETDDDRRHPPHPSPNTPSTFPRREGLPLENGSPAA
ncbi:MAG: hypothetical protein QXR26_06495 [Candidatus Caldarchaeum sp.]